MNNMSHSWLSSSLVLNANLICKIPDQTTFSEAATLPTVFLRVYYSLVSIAQIKKTDTVLIHTGSGGVGLAAIQLCKHFGAKVVSTAGSRRKRAYLRSIGVEHVYNSRDLSYGANIMEATNGKGVDLVLNSLTGPGFKETTLGICSKNARFVEMSKMSVWKPDEVNALRSDVHYTIVDITELSQETISDLFCKMEGFLQQGALRPLPFTRFHARHVRQALEYMRTAKHIGKVICTMPEIFKSSNGPTLEMNLFTPEGTYLITGGLGGAGFEICRWMLTSGATTIELMGRHPPNSQKAGQIEQWNNQGFTVIFLQANVGDPEECKDAFAAIAKLKRPLRGIIQCAGELDDRLFSDQDAASLEKSFPSKVNGTWNLHNLSKDMQLDHFVLFSSITALTGYHGQANYAAANCFLDSFAHYRYSLGLPATSINWGHWGEEGMAKTISFPGLQPMSLQRIINGLKAALTLPTTQVCVADFHSFSDFCKVCIASQHYMDPSLFIRTKKDVVCNAPIESLAPDQFWSLLGKTLESGNQLEFLKQVVTSTIKDATGCSATEKLSDGVPVATLGVDSLLSIEIKSKIQTILGSKVTLNNDMFSRQHSINDMSQSILKVIMGDNINIQSDTTKKVYPLTRDEMKALLEKDTILPEEVTPSPSCLPPCKPSFIRTVLVTGATGFIGRYTVATLCTPKYDAIKTVFVILPKNTKVKKGGIEVHLGLEYWSVAKAVNLHKIKIVEGDATLPKFGLSGDKYEELCQDVDAVIHCGGKINYVDPYVFGHIKGMEQYELRTLNVTSTHNVLRFACQSKIKHVYLMSTIGSPGTFYGDAETLSDSWPGREMIDWVIAQECPGYQMSKYVCEVLLHQAVLRGIPCKVFRHSGVAGGTELTEINFENEHLIRKYIAHLQVKAMSEIFLPSSNLPVNLIAKVSLEIFFSNEAPSDIYFIIHPRGQREKEFTDIAKRDFGVEIELVDHPEFVDRLKRTETALEPLKDFYLNPEWLIKVFSLPGLQRYRENPEIFRNDKLLRYVPNLEEILQPPLEYMRRDLKFALSQGHFKNSLKK